MTFHMLDLEVVDDSMNNELDRSTIIGESGGKKSEVIIICISYILCLQLFLHK